MSFCVFGFRACTSVSSRRRAAMSGRMRSAVLNCFGRVLFEACVFGRAWRGRARRGS